jgi:hypothetical protein
LQRNPKSIDQFQNRPLTLDFFSQGSYSMCIKRPEDDLRSKNHSEV